VSPARLLVVWRVTTRCNLGCGFCGYDVRLPRDRRDAEPSEVERFCSILAEWSAGSGRAVHLSWLGGEPLLWPRLDAIESRLSRHPQLSLGLTTNGTRLGEPEVRERLLCHYSQVTVSLDAASELHGVLRGWPDGYARLLEGLRRLLRERRVSRAPLRVRINCVLMRQTVTELERLCDLCGELGVDELTFNQLGGADRPEYHRRYGLMPEHVSELEDWLGRAQQRLHPRGVLLRGGPRYLERLRAAAEGRPQPIADCRPGEEFWFIDEAGRLGPCSFTLVDHAIDVRSLTRIEDLETVPARLRSARDRRRPASCSDCRSTQVFSKWEEPTLGALPPEKEVRYGT
jgi:AdoMet-dependent heme synthase